MSQQRAKLKWEPRVSPQKIRLLYETDARGILDEELLDEVAYAFYARCDSIVTVTEAVCRGRLRCPGCSDKIHLEQSGDDIVCPTCGWGMSRVAFRNSYMGQRLNGLGAIDAFQAFVDRFPTAHTPAQKMLLIDNLIHTMHNELAAGLQRPAAVNLIEGNVRTAVDLIEALAYGNTGTPGLGVARTKWWAVREAQSAGTEARK
jgi:DNA-directed RNA polymerase subunit RPC12/RpoP